MKTLLSFISIMLALPCFGATLTNLSTFPRTNRLYGSNFFVVVQVANGSNTIRLVPVSSGLTNVGIFSGPVNMQGNLIVDHTLTAGALTLDLSGSRLLWIDSDGQVQGATLGDGLSLDSDGLLQTTNDILTNFSTSATVQIDRALASSWDQTNRLAAASTLNITNISAGQSLDLTVPGEVSGGTDRDITLAWPAGWFASYHLNTVTNGLTTTTVAAGTTVEINIRCGVLQSTNTARVVIGRYPR